MRDVLSSSLRVDASLITPESAFGDLPQWDSMGHMEVMISLEDRFGVEVSAETIGALISVQAICDHIAENARA